MEQARELKSIEIERSIGISPRIVSFRLAVTLGSPIYLARNA